MKMSWKSPGILKDIYEVIIQYFWHDLYPPKGFLTEMIALENLNFDLESPGEALEKPWEKSWKMHMKKCGNPAKGI